MIQWYKKVVFENYANFNGRARRSEYWYFTLFNLILSLITMSIDKMLGLEIGLNTIYSLAVFIPGLAVSFRRLHDIGKSGWWLIIIYLAIIIAAVVLVGSGLSALAGMSSPEGFGLGAIISLIIILGLSVWVLIMFCTNGDVGENKYGPDPKADGSEGINQIGEE
ncbi:DUF805 domain-containing protein [Flavobacterium sp.]|uniref:DUF805 domain-containing protein n=1 Tax=Flavobacterium sp. TaxID=239 RepID=UPI002FDE8E7B